MLDKTFRGGRLGGSGLDLMTHRTFSIAFMEPKNVWQFNSR